MDNYFRNREEYPLDENGQPDFEALGCVDIPQFNEDTRLRPVPINSEQYSFTVHGIL